MFIRVLGSAAGGGFPQWNCNCFNCHGTRAGILNTRVRTQSSIAVRGRDDKSWVLVNASPDILTQLRNNPDLQPARGVRDHSFVGVVLTDSQLDHVTGLLMLRESTRPWPLWCTQVVHDDLTHANPVINVLGHYCGVQHSPIPLDATRFAVAGVDDLSWRAIPVASKGSPYSRSDSAGTNVALVISDTHTRRSVVYAPAIAHIGSPLWEEMQRADCVLVDGTFWTDDEMSRARISSRRAADMGHLALEGDGGLLEWLSRLHARTRRVLIHINNANPILREDSIERARLSSLGVEVSHDGMEVAL